MLPGLRPDVGFLPFGMTFTPSVQLHCIAQWQPIAGRYFTLKPGATYDTVILQNVRILCVLWVAHCGGPFTLGLSSILLEAILPSNFH